MALWKFINVGNALLIARWRCIRFATFIHVDADGVAVYRIYRTRGMGPFKCYVTPGGWGGGRGGGGGGRGGGWWG